MIWSGPVDYMTVVIACFISRIVISIFARGLRTHIVFQILWHSATIHCDGLGPQIYLESGNIRSLISSHRTKPSQHYFQARLRSEDAGRG